MKTKLEIFTEVSKHLLTQNRRSEGIEGDCLYLAPNGDKCAVGCLIKPEFYKSSMEFHAIHSATQELSKALLESGISDDQETVELLTELQHLHDNEPIICWKDELARLYRNHFGKSIKQSKEFMKKLKEMTK
jgi:hypothetical protein